MANPRETQPKSTSKQKKEEPIKISNYNYHRLMQLQEAANDVNNPDRESVVFSRYKLMEREAEGEMIETYKKIKQKK